jgi:diguanylate cyclase (GGDEF)-like protein/PAS domain S-box-containing protein
LTQRVIDPTLLAVPLVAVAFVVLEHYHLIAHLSSFAICGLLGGGYLVSAAATAWCPPGVEGRRLYARVSVEMIVIGSILYAIGWGPTLALGLLFGVIDCTRTHGTQASRPAMISGLAVMALGQSSIALGWAPTLVRPSFVQALAVLAGLGFFFSAELVRLVFHAKEEVQTNLVANERRFKALVQHGADVIVVIRDGRFEYVSPAFHQVLGYGPETLAHLSGAELIHADDMTNLVRAMQSPVDGFAASEIRLRTADGEWRWFDARVADLNDDPDVAGVVANLHDIDDRKRAEAALSEAEERFRTAFEDAPIGMGLIDRDGRWIRVNHALADLLGHAQTELMGASVSNITHPDDRAVTVAEHQRVVAGTADRYQLEKRYLRSDGSDVLVLVQGSSVRDAAGLLRYVIEEMEDITERRRAEEALRASESSFRLLFASNPQPMWVYSQSSLRFLEVNQAAIDHYGYSRDEFLAMSLADIRPDSEREALWQSAMTPRPNLQRSGTWRHRCKDGRVIEVDVASHQLMFNEEDAVLVAAVDVTERNALEGQLRRQAERDELTGLANRTLMRQRTDEALARGRQLGTTVAVIQVDLDDFGQINDVFGHDAGDLVLVRAASVLRDIVGIRGTVARTGSDEFAVLLGHFDEAAESLGSLAERILDRLAEPLEMAGAMISIEAAVGIARGPHPDEDAAHLIQRAATALARSKESLLRYEIDDTPLGRVNNRQRLAVIAELRQAIDHGQLRLHYQPKAELATGRVVGVEALVRWEHPERGLIPPDEFVPLAERTGLIRPLTSFVLEAAVEQLARWLRAGMSIGLSVNLGAANLTDRDLPKEIGALLRCNRVAARSLTLEITEVATMIDPTSTDAVVADLGDVGVELSIDDFGTGHSSLTKLRSLPITEIKLDKSFVSSMLEQNSDATIVRSSIDLAHNLGLRVVAEGIETQEVAEELQFLGCEIGQGNWLSRPLEPSAVTTWMEARMRGDAPFDASLMGRVRKGLLRAVPKSSA